MRTKKCSNESVNQLSTIRRMQTHMIRIIIPQLQQSLLQGRNPGSREADSQNLHWLGADPGWRLWHAVEILLQEVPEVGIHCNGGGLGVSGAVDQIKG